MLNHLVGNSLMSYQDLLNMEVDEAAVFGL